MRVWSALAAFVLLALSGCTQSGPSDPKQDPVDDGTPVAPVDGGDGGGDTGLAPGLDGIGEVAPPVNHAGNATANATKPKEKPIPPDPLAVGPLAYAKAYYDFGEIVVTDPTTTPYQYPVPVNGSIHAPSSGGPYPLVVLLHGRHGTCSYAGLQEIFLPCANAVIVEPIDSFQGYDYLAANLASHGYVVVSVDANAINDKDLLGDSGANARAQLVLHTIDDLAELNATGAVADAPPGVSKVPDLKGRIDMSRIGLMGHSRGGEGVAATVDTDNGAHGIDALFALAPTDFARWDVSGVAFATLLPYCDGDVSDLEGSWMYDDAREAGDAFPKHQLLAMGADHNFYNTIWTGDDWGASDAWCGGKGRDTGDLQRSHGLAAMASFFRLYVGGESAFAPYWDGSAQFPDAVCGAPCADRLHLAREPAKAHGIVLDRSGGGGKADGFDAHKACTTTGCPGTRQIGAKPVTTLGWKAAATITYTGTWDASKCDALTFRAGVPTDQKTAPQVQVSIASADGHMARVSANAVSSGIYAPPGGTAAVKTVMGGVRLPLEEFEGIDWAHVTSVTLGFGPDPGAMDLVDVLFQC